MQPLIPDTASARGEVIRALYDVAAAAASGDRDPSGIAQLAVDRATRLLAADGGVVFMWDAETELLQPVYETASASPETPLRPGEGMAGLAFQTRRATAVEDYRTLPARVPSAAARQIAGALAVPMVIGLDAIGALGLWTYEQRRFREDEVHLLSLFAAHVAPVLQAARAAEDRRRQGQAFRALHELSMAASGVLDPLSLGRLAVEHVSRLLRVESATLRWWDPAQERLHLLATNDPCAAEFESAISTAVGASGKAFRTREPVIIDDYRRDGAAHPGSDRWGLRAVLAVPLVVGDLAVGTLVAATRSRRRFRPDDANVLSLLAAQVAPALVAARLAEERSQAATRFRTLYEVAVGVSGVLEPAAIMEEVVRSACQLLKTPQATLVTWDERAGLLHCVRDAAGLLSGYDLRPGEGIAGQTFVRREPVVVEDYQTWEHAVGNAALIGYRSAVSVPLTVHDRAVGTLAALSLERRAFSPEDVQTLSLLAGLVAPALESAQLHADLARSEERFRSLYGTMSCGVVVQAPDGRIVDANLQAASIFGHPLEELVGRQALGPITREVTTEDGAPVPPDQRPTVAAIKTRLPVRNRVLGYAGPDGTPTWLRIDAVPVLDEAGEITELVSSFFDVTDLKDAQAQLLESRRRLEEVVSHAPVVLSSLDSEGVFTLSEGSGLRLLGLEPGEHVGRSIFELYSDQAPIVEHFRKGMAGESGTFAFSLGGRELETVYSPVRDAAGCVVGVTSVSVDVTERSRAEEAVRESEAKSRFLAAMSHELRTPLNSILGFAQLLKSERFGPLNERQERYVEYVGSSGKHLLDLINEVLDLSKVQAGHMEVRPERVAADEAGREAVARIRLMAEAKSLVLRTRIAPGLAVRADRLRLAQVLLNLLSNAVKFTDEGGTVRLTIRPGRGDTVIFQVRDSGIGIAAEQRERIFEDFVQVAMGRSRTHEGTGLGLPLSRRLAELMGGRLTFESSPGRGSLFTLELPAAEP
ncbi:MAG: GAF domain-containing protein [Candidatus Dormibacterales bacterium]